MAPESLDAAQKKRNRLPFKPPRRQSSIAAEGSSAAAPKTTKSKSATKKSTASATARRKSTAMTSKKRKAQTLPESDDEDDDDNNASEDGSGSESGGHERSASQEPDYILAEIITNEKPHNIESGEPAIPPKLLTKLLHQHFQNKKTKITKDANEVVAKYMDIFVREALARAAYERTEGGGGNSAIDGFLEVEDLEKLAPQMTLDF
ncbi:CENP-S associating centromere protein X-domain-containing protein [Talaromyces proteolyticus]|uniref:CENP-S associating centromere protein X-domain-containing protein n=1 Tax=Talaromyces proteolyticus TaxID=1131652 RepID=A0AAD4KS44_9EURO|nr:CENP-S associating centromere protein X-domain-containing protein [Talaromyces proteolyticus]KAH8699139.1 CENP-S associating centromere protein X-domain-containing protein [Talaromyces proteolyticus]